MSRRRFLAALLAIALMASLFPATALAEGEPSLEGIGFTEPLENSLEGGTLPQDEGIGGEAGEGATLSGEAIEEALIPLGSPYAGPISPLSIVGGYTITYDSSSTIIGSYDTLAAAIAACANADPTGSFTITVTGNDADMGTTAIVPSGLSITLTSGSGGPYTITQASTDYQAARRHLEVEGTLELANITLSGNGAYTDTSPINGGIEVNNGVLILGDGAAITNCSGERGGGIYAAASSSVTLKGTAEVSSNKASIGGGVYLENSGLVMGDDSKVESNTSQGGNGGGGIYARSYSTVTMDGSSSVGGNSAGPFTGGGIALEYNASMILNSGSIEDNSAGMAAGVLLNVNSSFTMNGGAIQRNETHFNSSNGGNGGGVVILSGCTFDLYRGSINNNVGDTQAGGVSVYSSSNDVYAVFNMHGGVIGGNSINNALSTISGYANGGGIHIGNRGKVNMYGGEIRGNTAVTGGGIACSTGGYLYIGPNPDPLVPETARTIRGNSAEDGGGIYAANVESFTLDGVLIDGNKSVGYGGGVSFHKTQFTTGNSAVYLINDVELTNNLTASGVGGGLFLYQRAGASGGNIAEYTIEGCDISGNSAAEEGGGIFVWHHSNAPTASLDADYRINNTAIMDNTSYSDGGGIYFYHSAGQADYSLNDSTIAANTAVDGGGVLFDHNAGIATYNLASSTIVSNQASGSGGGLYLYGDAEVITTGGEITANTAGGSGGGIYADVDSSFTMSEAVAVTDNTAIYGNRADIADPASAGDDVYAVGTSTSVTLLDAGLMPIPAEILGWYHDAAGARYRDNASTVSYLPVAADTSPLALTLGINFIITYDANGGSGSFTDMVAAHTSYTVLDIAETGIAREGHRFTGWNTQKDGGGTPYAPGDVLMPGGNVNLYAQWDKIPPDPKPDPNPGKVSSASSISKASLAKTSDATYPYTEIALAMILALMGAAGSVVISKRRNKAKIRLPKEE